MTAVYLDYNATTPVDPQVLEAMLPWFTERFWNAASAHPAGESARRAVESARAQVASLINASPREIVWTSGSTEANNLAIKGASATGGRSTILVAASEHKAVLDVGEALGARGQRVVQIPVGPSGSVDLAALETRLSAEDVAVVSVMLANNETGVIQPLERVVELSHAHGALVHTDATQAVGKISVDVQALGADLLSLSAHKFYGPKGIGALYVRRGTALEPQLHGGGHEGGYRSGTLNVPGAVGMGEASRLAESRLQDDGRRASELIGRLVDGLKERLPGVAWLGEQEDRLPNTANLHFAAADAEAVMANAPAVFVSSGSACSSRVPEPSHVLRAMGLSEQEAYECLRFSVGRGTRAADIDVAIETITNAVQRVRRLTASGPMAGSEEGAVR